MNIMVQDVGAVINSPIVVALTTIVAGGTGAVLMGIIRILVRLARIETEFTALHNSVMRALEDKDIMRWSTLSGAHVHVGNVGNGGTGDDK